MAAPPEAPEPRHGSLSRGAAARGLVSGLLLLGAAALGSLLGLPALVVGGAVAILGIAAVLLGVVHGSREHSEAHSRLASAQSTQARLEADVDRSRERYQSLIENVHDLISEMDGRGRLIYISPNSKELLGDEPDEIIGTDAWDRIHPEDLATCWKVFEAATGAAGTGRADLRYRHRDGRWRWFEVRGRGFQVPDGTTHIALVGRDVTERKEAEEASRITNRRLRTLVTHAPVILFAIDGSGTVTRCEGRGLESTGLKPSDVVGRTIEELSNGVLGENPRLRENLSRAMGGEEFGAVVEFRGRVFDTWYSAAYTDEGNPEGVIGVANDITDLVMAEEERSRVETQMQRSQKLESLGVLAGGIAHDFNNLLTTILGQADLTLMDLPRDRPPRESVARIRDAAHRAAELTNQLLAYAGRGQVKVQPLSLSQLVQDMGELLKVSVSKKAEFDQDLARTLPLVEGDTPQITQVILNLITNASDALEDGTGKITIRTGTAKIHGREDPDAYPTGAPPEGEYVYLEVVDTGSGMDAATKTRMFDPFYTTRVTGRGLGLAAVLGIVRAHGGSVRVESDPGRGTTFRVLFPAHKRTTQTGDERPTAKDPWSATGKVLVVDDEAEVRTVAGAMLRRLGFEAIQASDGRAGLEEFRASRHSVTAVLLDMTMSELGGEEAFHEIRRISPSTPVLLMSGYTDQRIPVQLGDCGPTAFLSKPFTLDELRGALRGILAPTSSEVR